METKDCIELRMLQVKADHAAGRHTHPAWELLCAPCQHEAYVAAPARALVAAAR